MFPNVRLLIVALFASVVALGCGFGMFAALRVNHEPFGRLPVDTAPLQLVADDAAPPEQAAQPIAAASEPAPPAGVPAPQTQQPETRAVQAPPDVKQGDAANKTSEPAAAAGPAIAVIEPAVAQTPPAEQPTEMTNTVPETAAPDAKTSPKLIGKLPAARLRNSARTIVKRRRVAAKKQTVRKTRAPAVAQSGGQNSTIQQPFFQSAPDTFHTQPAKRRRTVKRTAKRTAKQTVKQTAKNAAVSGLVASPNGQ